MDAMMRLTALQNFGVDRLLAAQGPSDLAVTLLCRRDLAARR